MSVAIILNTCTPVDGGRRVSDGGDGSVRYGHRQSGRAVRDPLELAQERGGEKLASKDPTLSLVNCCYPISFRFVYFFVDFVLVYSFRFLCYKL